MVIIITGLGARWWRGRPPGSTLRDASHLTGTTWGLRSVWPRRDPPQHQLPAPDRLFRSVRHSSRVGTFIILFSLSLSLSLSFLFLYHHFSFFLPFSSWLTPSRKSAPTPAQLCKWGSTCASSPRSLVAESHASVSETPALTNQRNQFQYKRTKKKDINKYINNM